jgi:pimeloyl-ACP methyl ester carboxylesterase
LRKDFDRLLERIVLEAQQLCNADGGTLYLRTEDDRLRFVIVRNRSLNIAMGGPNGKDIPFPPLRLYDEESGKPLYNYVVTNAALSGEAINISDAYDAEGYDFSGTREFDARTGYRSTSMLNIPLRDGLGRVIGVLQLLNAQDEHGTIIPFDQTAEQMIISLGALAATALAAYAREQQLRQEINNLRIEIDQARQTREVEQITSTNYFNQIQARARQMRAGKAPQMAERPQRSQHDADPQDVIFTIRGQPIHARVQGSRQRRVLLLIHGWSSSWYAMSPLLPSLSERYRCVAVDLPGFGESPPLPQRASIPAYADLLADLIHEISPEQPAILIGHSMGGMISLTMAMRRREVIERMVLICPTISGNLSFWINTFISPITMLERSRIANRVVAGIEPYMLTMTDRLMRPASFAERTGITQADYEKLRADARRPGQGRIRAECYNAMRANDLRGRLKGLDVPALVLWGMEDNTVPLRDASVVADEWPEAELRVLPKAGHWPQFETPDITNRHIRGFLSTPIKLLTAQF